MANLWTNLAGYRDSLRVNTLALRNNTSILRHFHKLFDHLRVRNGSLKIKSICATTLISAHTLLEVICLQNFSFLKGTFHKNQISSCHYSYKCTYRVGSELIQKLFPNRA